MKPNFYKQIDSRWSSYYCRAGGGYPTLGAHGCGPTCCTNVISATTHSNWQPKKLFQWACANGFMTATDGLYWSGIEAMLMYGGIKKPIQTTNHDTIKKSLQKGDWIIAIMGPGNWTRGGHFILVYSIDSNNNIYVSDPASYASYRSKNTFKLFTSQMRNCWIIENPAQYVKSPDVPKETKEIAMYVSRDKAPVRTKAKSTKNGGKIVARIKFNKKLRLVPYNDNWYKINSGTYKGKFIHKHNLSKYRQETAKYKTRYIMNLRDGYSTKSTLLQEVPKGVTLKSTKRRGNWAYFPKQKGLSKGGFIRIKDSKYTYLKKVK